MARVSRKKRTTLPVSVVSAAKGNHSSGMIQTALYARLSVEQDDNDTIQNQVALLQNYIKEHEDLGAYRIYTDNGFTGTNFNRPAFQEMMQEVQSGTIRCVVVKDLSRLGRNFIETGYMIETLFPKLNVRLISINDHYDSLRNADLSDISVPVRNMVNELYAKDVSRKICASNEARRRSGNYTIEKCIYGYQVDKDSNQFIINPETAPIVVMIFRWFIDGVQSSEIAKRLNALNIETPKEYKYRNEFGAPLEKKQYWDSGKVRSILTKEAYTGDRFLGTRRNRLYKNQHKQEWLPKEAWTVYSDDHPPLVSREDMDTAMSIIRDQRQKLRAAKQVTNSIPQNREGLFSNLVFCKKCGILMYHQILKYPDGRIKPEGHTYDCRGRAQIDDRRGCGLRIKEGYLQPLVAGQVQLLINTVIDQEAAIRNIKTAADDRNPLYSLRRATRDLKDQIDECDNKNLMIYEDLTSGILDQQDFSELRKSYQAERADLELKLVRTQKELQEKEKSYQKIRQLAKKLKPYTEHLALTRELIDMLIDRIEVDEDLNVEIHFKCADVYKGALTDSRAGENT